MIRNKLKNKIAAIRFGFYTIIPMIKLRIVPEKIISLTKNEAMDLYSSLNAAVSRENQIYYQIENLRKMLTDNQMETIPELHDFDFELFKLRFQGDYYVLSFFVDSLRKDIFLLNETNTIHINKSFYNDIKEIESEMNLKIELMRIIRNFIEITEKQVTRQMRKDFKMRVHHIFQG